MSIAGRHGKLSETGGNADGWSRVEDLLTADVFGAYRYLPARLGVIPFLLRAQSAEGQTLAQWLTTNHVSPDELDHAVITFWPTLAGKEPDLLVEFSAGGVSKLAILVEAKLHSGQHDIDGISQIAHYAHHHILGAYDDLEHGLPELRPVVFLTKHTKCPLQELHRARDESPTLENDEAPAIFWVSWDAARELAVEAREAQRGQPDSQPWLRLLEDLIEDLAVRGIYPRAEPRYFPLPKLEQLPADYGHCLAELNFAERRQPAAGFPFFVEVELAHIDEALNTWRIV